MEAMEQIAQWHAEANEEFTAIKRRLNRLVFVRIFIFLCFSAAVFALRGSGSWPLLPLVLGIILFLLAVKAHAKLREKHALCKAFMELCSEELDCAQGKWRDRKGGEEYSDAAHPYASDLNVFGKHSLFQKLNRCQRPTAGSMLAAWLKAPIQKVAEIERERDIIKDFARQPKWSLHYLAIARVGASDSDEKEVANKASSANGYEGPRAGLRPVISYLLPILSIGCTLAFALDAIGWNQYLLCMMAAGIPAMLFLRKHLVYFHSFTQDHARLNGVEAMLTMIRERSFDESPFAERLKALDYEQIETALGDLKRIAGAVDSRGNIFVGIALNLLLFWDFQVAYRIADWRREYEDKIAQWLKLAAEVEALQSLALYRFTHPDNEEVQWTEDWGMEASEAWHPLMDGEVVGNPIDLSGEIRFAIITGANMAGKSTYLRMTGLIALMAMRGLPVPARGLRLSPMRIHTSMLTADSLGESASFFFNELKRLRAIADALESGERHLVILDEILKGTNSVDKAEGSKLFLRKLLGLPAKGLIATHDLSLCTAEEDHPGKISNFRFEMDFKEGKASFDYQLRPGVCQNMNAAFLLREMGLTEATTKPG